MRVLSLATGVVKFFIHPFPMFETPHQSLLGGPKMNHQTRYRNFLTIHINISHLRFFFRNVKLPVAVFDDFPDSKLLSFECGVGEVIHRGSITDFIPFLLAGLLPDFEWNLDYTNCKPDNQIFQ